VLDLPPKRDTSKRYRSFEEAYREYKKEQLYHLRHPEFEPVGIDLARGVRGRCRNR